MDALSSTWRGSGPKTTSRRAERPFTKLWMPEDPRPGRNGESHVRFDCPRRNWGSAESPMSWNSYVTTISVSSSETGADDGALVPWNTNGEPPRTKFPTNASFAPRRFVWRKCFTFPSRPATCISVQQNTGSQYALTNLFGRQRAKPARTSARCLKAALRPQRNDCPVANRVLLLTLPSRLVAPLRPDVAFQTAGHGDKRANRSSQGVAMSLFPGGRFLEDESK